MKFQLTQELSDSLLRNGKSSLIINFSQKLENFFKAKSYGKGVLSIFIGIICVAPEFDFFFKIRKPKYKKGKEIIIQDDIEIEIESTLRFDLKLSYKNFVNATEIEAKKILAMAISNSLDVLDNFKIKDFNSENFKEDLRFIFDNDTEMLF